MRPIGYSLLFITFGVPVALVGCLLAGGAWPALAMLGITALARIVLHWTVRRPLSTPAHLLALPLRDGLSLALWAWGFVNAPRALAG